MMNDSMTTKAMTMGRFLIAAVALAGGILMIMFPTVEANLRINAAISFINPVIFSLINLIGITGMAGKAPVYKLVLITVGAALIVAGTF
jgi:hypothetical protein